MNISDIAQKTGLTPKAIRFYEDKSLITPPERGENGEGILRIVYVARQFRFYLFSQAAAVGIQCLHHHIIRFTSEVVIDVDVTS